MDWYKLFSSLAMFLILTGGLTSVQSKCPRLTITNGRVRTRNRGHMASFICNEGFHRVGPRFSVCLSTGLWTQRKPLCVGVGCAPVQGIPNLQIESQYGGAVLKFSCKPGFYRNGPEQIFCDGSQWSSEAPQCIEGVNLGCDFETESLCGWSQDDTDDFDWTWHKGHTPTSDTGPSVDHTTNSTNGHYLYIESSAPTKKDFKARLLSPVYQPTDLVGHCLQFYYHMLGPEEPGEMGHLQVYIQPSSIATTMLFPSDLIFSAKTNMGDQWHKADFEIPPQTKPVQIIFQGTRMRSWNSDIALDDVKLYHCPEGPDSLGDTTESPIVKEESTTTSISPTTTTINATSPSLSTVGPDDAEVTSPVGNVTAVDKGGDPTASTVVNETITTSSTGNFSSENTTAASNQTSEVATSDVGEVSENSTTLTFRPTHEGGDKSTRVAGTTEPDSTPQVRQSRNQQPGAAARASTSSEILPIVIGILVALVIVVVFVAVVVWAVARRKQKRDAEIEDELKIITKSSEAK